MNKVTIYTMDYCPYCIRAKSLLERKKIKFTEINLHKEPNKFEEMQKNSNGARTLPQIFVNDKFIKNKILRREGPFLKTVVGNNVLIGSNVTILPIHISDNAVVGAGSVVTKNCKKNKTYIGNPAKILKK